MIRETSTIKRSDLTLRCRYVGLETEIYQIDQYRYVIYCKNYSGDFDKLRTDFNHSIRQVGTQVELTQSVPNEYLFKVEPIPLSNAVDGFKGAYITQSDVENAIIDRFPDVDICKIHAKPGPEFSIIVDVGLDTPLKTMADMEAALLSIDLGTDQIEVRHTSGKPSRPNEPRSTSVDVLQLGINKQLPFTIDEADYWFDNADKIYSGQLNRDSLPKVYSQTTSCCLDCSMHNPVNIRSALLLYDTIYLILPMENGFDVFLREQNLTRNELLDLTAMGKVTFVLNNLESRYGKQFLLDAYHCNPLSIIGRRGINTVVASFMVETRNKFLSHFPNAMDTALIAREIAEKSEDPIAQTMANILAWPIVEPANSFRLLNSSGPLSFGTMGLDRILLPLHGRNSKEASDDLTLLLNFAGNTVFLSSAFNSTLFSGELPGGSQFNQGRHMTSSLISDLLQIYWYDPKSIESIKSIRNRSFDENQAINLFDCKQNVSAVEVAELANQYKTFIGFKRIIDNLGQMSESERIAQIRMYNDTLLDLAKTRPTADKIDFLLSSSSFLPLPYSFSLISAIMSFIKGKVSDLDAVREQAERKQIEQCLKSTRRPHTPEIVEDIYTLDKISRVAGLR